MSDTSQAPDKPGNLVPTLMQHDHKRWQVGLRSLFLLTAAIAVWLSFFLNRRHNAALEARLKTMVPLAHELIVDDPKKIAVVTLDEWIYNEHRWDLYLPEGQYRLCLATRGIDLDGLAPVMKSAALKAGRHHMALDQRWDRDVWRVTVAWDGTGVLAVEELKDWDPGAGGWAGPNEYSVSEQRTADKPVVLFRRRFFVPEDRNSPSRTSDGPTEGVLLWIEKVGGSNVGP